MRILYLITFSAFIYVTDGAVFADPNSFCGELEEGLIGRQTPALKPSNHKTELIEERRRLKQTGDPELLKKLRGWGGTFQRDHTLASGERLSLSAMAEIQGEVLFLRHMAIGRIAKQKLWLWSYDYVDTAGKAESSPREMRQILNDVLKESKKAGISLVVLEGQRQTGARGESKPWVQVVIDLRNRDFQTEVDP